MGQDAGLAAAGPGQDEQRPIGRRDGPGLLRIEPPDDPRRPLLDGGETGSFSRRDGRGILVRRLVRTRRVRQPGGFLERRRGRRFELRECRSRGLRDRVEGTASAAATSGGTHHHIVGGAPLREVPPVDRGRCVTSASPLFVPGIWPHAGSSAGTEGQGAIWSAGGAAIVMARS